MLARNRSALRLPPRHSSVSAQGDLFREGRMSNTQDVKRYLVNRQKEIDGAAMYLALAETEKQPQMSNVYRKLAASEEKHATAW